MKKKLKAVCLIWILVSGAVVLPKFCRAEPYLAARTGYKCSQCHVNPTGGGKRTDFGLMYSYTRLPHRFVKRSNEALFDNRLNDYISLGADLRVNNQTIFGVDRENDNSIEIRTANAYVEMELIKDLLTLYVDENLGPSGASNREAYGILYNLPLRGYFKAGRMLLPFGLRLLDNAAFIREKTGFNYNIQDFGIEGGIEPGPFSFSVALSNGSGRGLSDDNRSKQVSLIGYVVFRHFRFGGSFSRNKFPGTTRKIYGHFAGANFGRLTLLSELDFIDSDRDDRFGKELAFLGELDFLITKGINLKVTYDFWDRFFDADPQVDEDESERVTIGLEPFITQFLQLSVFYHINDSVPQRPRESEDRLTFELHVFF